ncbi:MAG TPA: hypothetical protein VHW09_13415 [Bryobacteraceae bacterium]|jgi:ABC-type transporter Mla subunit MlaD|nr:hypothetical protein [Bryobacteraceae bacterium]
MSTLSSAWSRLKAPLEAAVKGKSGTGASADAKKSAAALHTFETQIAPVMKKLDDALQERTKLSAKLRSAAEEGLKLVDPMYKQAKADKSLDDEVKDRLDEVGSLLREVRRDGAQVQWD